jgi:hypothetical protein
MFANVSKLAAETAVGISARPEPTFAVSLGEFRSGHRSLVEQARSLLLDQLHGFENAPHAGLAEFLKLHHFPGSHGFTLHQCEGMFDACHVLASGAGVNTNGPIDPAARPTGGYSLVLVSKWSHHTDGAGAAR